MVLTTFDKAFFDRGNPKNLIFHSDQGTQYTSSRFQYALQKNNVRQSLSKPGTPYDNAVMERFFKSIKYECLKHKTFQNIDELRTTVEEYNPQSVMGKRVLNTALETETPPAHLIVKTDQIKKGIRGRVQVSFYRQTSPEANQRLISTFISHEGEKLDITPEEFFDHIIGTEPIQNFGYADLLHSLHEKDIKAAADKDKQSAAEILQEETEKLNRWKYDEMNGIHLSVSKIKNKIDAAHKQLYSEKIISRKLALRRKIAHLQEKFEQGNLASLDKEKSINLAYKRLLDRKKKALKFDYSVEAVFDCTFTVFL